jgi:hypothetical protein
MNDVDVLVGDLAGLKTEQQKLFRAQSCVAVVPRASLGEGSSSVCVRVYIFQDLHICVWSCTVFHICAGKGSDGGVRQRPRHTCQMDAGTLMHVHAHTHETHTHTKTHTHTNTHKHTHTHTYTHIYRHTHTHTHTHTHIHIQQAHEQLKAFLQYPVLCSRSFNKGFNPSAKTSALVLRTRGQKRVNGFIPFSTAKAHKKQRDDDFEDLASKAARK